MASSLQGEYVLRHLERFLGSSTRRWLIPGNEAAPFQVLLFPNRPNSDSQCLVTYGLSAFPLRITGKSDSVTRIELAICADLAFDSKAIVATLIAVGLDAIKKNATPGLHEILEGESAILSNPVFQHFYLTFPGYFPAEFGLCETLSPPVAIVQLVPVSSKERDLIAKKGWRAFEEEIVKQGIDLLKFDERGELIH